MINLNKNKETILQKVERVARLVLDPKYQNSRICPKMNYLVYQQWYPPVVVNLITNNIWNSCSKLEAYDRNNMAFKFQFVYLHYK